MFSIAFGGKSSEREISYPSLQYILDITGKKEMLHEIDSFIHVLADGKVEVAKNHSEKKYRKKNIRHLHVQDVLEFSTKKFDSMLEFLTSKHGKELNAVYSLLYGEHGEDGKYTALFDALGIPVTTNSPMVDAVLMDKYLTGKMVSGKTLKPISGFLATKKMTRKSIIDQVRHMKDMGIETIVIKPNDLGSSIGTTTTPTSNVNVVVQLIENLLPLSWTGCLVQPYVKGRELSISFGITRNGMYRAMTVNEVLMDGETCEFNSFEAKHGDLHAYKSFDMLYSAQYGLQVPEEFAALVLDATRFVNELGVIMPCRMDVIRTANADYLLEVNTMPGVTAKSIFPVCIDVVDSDRSPFVGGYWNQIIRMIGAANRRISDLGKKTYSDAIAVSNAHAEMKASGGDK